MKTAALTSVALIAFAINSVLCRLALEGATIDAGCFTFVRLASGALVLFIIVKLRGSATQEKGPRGSWLATFMLLLYAISFSFAYLSLDTGTGALILFGSVQITMIVLSILGGTRLHSSEWIGVIIAFSGFVYLVLPGVSAPSTLGFLLMSVSGIGWGVYTLKGRGSKKPLIDTTYNFLRSVPFVLFFGLATLQNAHYSKEGIFLAILSGGLASGLGYTIWYAALSGLTATQAAVVQLFVPVLAAFGGVVFIDEVLSLRLAVSAGLILGGILMVVLGKACKDPIL
jgi:drug/metabolite transporter (DMT)-like permease